jgi:hypothetical protein
MSIAMKALSTTILIVVTAVVILVAALVVLTIFGSGIGQVGTLTNFENNCRIQCATTCKMGGLPPTWDVQVKVGDEYKKCRDIIADCAACGVTTPTGGGNTPSGAGTPPTCNSGYKVCGSKCISIVESCVQ